MEVTKNGFLKNILSGVWRSFRLQNHKSGLWRVLNIFFEFWPTVHTGPEFKKWIKNLHNPLIKFLTFLSRKSQKEWSVEEFYIVNFQKKPKNQQKSNERVVIPRKGVDQTMKKLTSDELWCFPQKEFIPFLGDHTSLNENLSVIWLIF